MTNESVIQERFERFDRENPQVYEAMVQKAEQLRAFGHYGIGAIFEDIRYDYRTKNDSRGEKFKLNNNYRSRYARKLMAQERGFEGFFETRRLRN
jgi:hypothetical protein